MVRTCVQGRVFVRRTDTNVRTRAAEGPRVPCSCRPRQRYPAGRSGRRVPRPPASRRVPWQPVIEPWMFPQFSGAIAKHRHCSSGCSSARPQFQASTPTSSSRSTLPRQGVIITSSVFSHQKHAHLSKGPSASVEPSPGARALDEDPPDGMLVLHRFRFSNRGCCCFTSCFVVLVLQEYLEMHCALISVFTRKRKRSGEKPN